MAKRVIMVVSFILALIGAACAGICIFNLPSVADLIGWVIGMICIFTLFSVGFIRIGLVAYADILAEKYEENNT